MGTKRLVLLLKVAFVAMFINACSQQDTSDSDMQQNISVAKIPEVNDENCRPEIINMIEDKAARQKFASLCFRRSRYKPSPKKDW